jgi:LPXTG-site transpeptidase (sortase) family protein
MEFFDILNYIGYEVHPIGELILPTIDIRLPILQGTSDANMTLGAGTTRPGMVMGAGNFVLGSHTASDVGTRFGGLHLLEVGDLIILRDADYLYLYEIIIANYVVYETRLDIIDEVPGKIYVTLFTCTDVVNSDYRIVVRGEFFEQISIAQLQQSADLLAEFEAMVPTINVEIIRVVIESLEHTEIPFPTVSVALVIGGSIIAATGALWLSGMGGRKEKRVLGSD